MAHMSSVEKGQLLMKKYRAAKKKKINKENMLTEEEKAERNKLRNEPPSISEQVEAMIYDYEHHQLNPLLRPQLRELCHKRMAEIEQSNTQEINQRQIQRIKDTIRKMESEIDGTNGN